MITFITVRISAKIRTQRIDYQIFIQVKFTWFHIGQIRDKRIQWEYVTMILSMWSNSNIERDQVAFSVQYSEMEGDFATKSPSTDINVSYVLPIKGTAT